MSPKGVVRIPWATKRGKSVAEGCSADPLGNKRNKNVTGESCVEFSGDDMRLKCCCLYLHNVPVWAEALERGAVKHLTVVRVGDADEELGALLK